MHRHITAQHMHIFGHHISAHSAFLAFSEAILLLLILLVFSAIVGAPLGSELTWVSVILSLGSVIFFAALGLYNRDIIGQRRTMAKRLGIALLLFFSAANLAWDSNLFVHPMQDALPGFAWPLAIGLSCLALIVLRILFLLFTAEAGFQKRIAVIGAGQQSSELQSMSRQSIGKNYKIVCTIGLSDEKSYITPDFEIERDAVEPEKLFAELAAYAPDEIVVAPDNRRGLPIHALLYAKVKGLLVSEFLSFVERELGRVNLKQLTPSWLVFSNGFTVDRNQERIKRCFDIVVSAAFLLVTSPIIIVMFLLLRLESSGPVFYHQIRVGLDGTPFSIYKFRSMRKDAESDSGPRWAIADDDRVTRLGRFMRDTRIDEIPQVYNVLRGDMSFVGPRPERPFFVSMLQDELPFYLERHRVKPGITGWAQVNTAYGASVEDSAEKLSYDLYYVKNRSVFLDCIIMLQTVRVVFWPQGVH